MIRYQKKPGILERIGKVYGVGSVKRNQRRGGSRVWNFIKKAHKFIKDNKLVSRGANMLSKVLPPKYRQIAQGIGTGATALGYGRRRRRGYGLRLAGM